MDSHCRARVLGVAVLVVRSIRTFSATCSVTGSNYVPEHCATACGYPSLSCRQHQVLGYPHAVAQCYGDWTMTILPMKKRR